MHILDDDLVLKSFDKEGIYQNIASFPQMLEEAFGMIKDLEIPQFKNIKNIVIYGMGGSGIGGDFLKRVIPQNLPIFVIKSFFVPEFVSDDTLVICVSYSGNTKETILATENLLAKGLKNIILISSGGKLKEIAQKEGLFWIGIKGGYPPRQAFCYLFLPQLWILSKLINLQIEKLEESIKEGIYIAKQIFSKTNFQVPFQENSLKQFATILKDKLVLIYAVDGITDVVAYRFMTQLNENAKSFATVCIFPEICHNHIVAFERNYRFYQDFEFILFKEDYLPILQKQIDVFFEFLQKKPILIEPVGKGKLARLISLLYQGDIISLYLSILHKVSPYSIKSIDFLKDKLNNI